MGTDDLFHKRKATKVTQLQRAKESREPYDKVLIVCEGEKTEPHYLMELRGHLKLSQANIKIDPNSDSSPTSVVKYTKELIKESPKDPYDHVFCVIDRDRHFDYTTKLFGTSGDSPCMDLIKNNLKVFIEDYEKGDRAIMLPIIKSGLEMAVANAKRANETAKRNGTDNPTTQMDELVDYLKDLKDEK